MTSKGMSSIEVKFSSIKCYLIGDTRILHTTAKADYNSIVMGLTLWYGLLLDYNSMICSAAIEKVIYGRIMKHAIDGWPSGLVLTDFLKSIDNLGDRLLMAVASTAGFKGQLLLTEIKSWEVPAWMSPLKGIIKQLASCIDTTSEVGVAQLIRFVRQITSFLKKLDVNRPDLEESTRLEFLQFEEFLSVDVPRRDSSIEYLRNTFDMKELLSKHLDYFAEGPIAPCHGPGATADTSVKCWLDKHTQANTDSRVGYLLHHAGLGVQADYLPLVKTNSSTRVSRHICVPKTWKKLRGISAEPPELQFWQQGVLRRLDTMFTSDNWWASRINLHCQTTSRELARKGSLTGSLATIDLSAASDSVTLQLIRDVFGNSKLARWLLGTRSTHTMCGDALIKIHKFAPMGSACCFPVECIIFCLAAEIAVSRTRTSRDKDRTVCVYGDDIIVPTSAATCLIEILESLGFSVNIEKSFTTGYFREACGAEHWRGFDVVPCRFKRFGTDVNDRYITPDESSSIVALANELLRRGFHDTRAFLLEHLFKKVYNLGTHKYIRVQRVLLTSFSGECNTLASPFSTNFNLDVKYSSSLQRLVFKSVVWRERPTASKSVVAKLLPLRDVCKYTEWLYCHQDGITDYEKLWENGWIDSTSSNQWSRLPVGVTLVPTVKWVSSQLL